MDESVKILGEKQKVVGRDGGYELCYFRVPEKLSMIEDRLKLWDKEVFG